MEFTLHYAAAPDIVSQIVLFIFIFLRKIHDLQHIISKMPLQMCCATVLPEFGVTWRQLARAVRNSRLPMTMKSIARVLCRHVRSDKSLDNYQICEIIGRLRLNLVITQSRTWHVVTLSELTTLNYRIEEIPTLPVRIARGLKKGNTRWATPNIQTLMLYDMVYVSVQLVSDIKEGRVLYAATPGGPVALLSTLRSSKLIKAFVEGIGYKKYEDACLYGRDITSLLRIHNRTHNVQPDNLATMPEYAPGPVITPNGIDYTNRHYDSAYVDSVLGPNPPHLTELKLKIVKPFFDRNMFNRNLTLKFHLKSENVAKSFKSWVMRGAMSPTSDLFQIFDRVKSNQIINNSEDSD